MGTSRNPKSDAAQDLVKKGLVQRILLMDYADPSTIHAALTESNATRIWFTTDWYSIKKPSRSKEVALARNMIDVIVHHSNQIEHVVFNSVCDADNCSETVQPFWSKSDIEKYLKKKLLATSMTWSILRPVAFLDTLDDSKTMNPLTKGVVKALTKKNTKMKYISTIDIGKATAELLVAPSQYRGQIIDAAACECDGTDLARALTDASGVPSTYKVAVPRFIMYFVLNDLYHMMNWMETDGSTADIEAFKKVVPDAMDASAWFSLKGQWANGEKFAPKEA